MRTIKWSYDMLRTLREMYPHDTNTRIAAAIGVGTRCVVAKAAELGRSPILRRSLSRRIISLRLEEMNREASSASRFSPKRPAMRLTVRRLNPVRRDSSDWE